MGIVISLPSISQYSTVSWMRVSYATLTVEQKANFDYLNNNGLLLLYNTDGTVNTDIKYGAPIGSSVSVALYGTSDRLIGYYRKGNGHFVACQMYALSDYTNYDYIGVSNTPYNRVFESDIVYLTPFPAEYIFATAMEAYSALANYPITYRLTNCTAPTAPTEAAVGDTVTVPFQFTSGYGIVNPSSDVYVTNNGVVVPSQYSNGVLTFTMPDPS